MSPLEGKKEMCEHENMIFHAELFLNTLKQKRHLRMFSFSYVKLRKSDLPSDVN